MTQKIPNSRIVIREDGKFIEKDIYEYFAGKKIVAFALPGAFTPTCSNYHVPAYEEEYENKNEITITGIAKKPSNINYLKLGDEKFTNKAIVQNIDFTEISKEFNVNLNDIIITLDKQAIEGYLPNINLKKNKHYTNFSYAGQWLLFFVVYIFMLTRIYRNEKNK